MGVLPPGCSRTGPSLPPEHPEDQMRVGARWVWRGVALLVTLLMLD
ncbi:hypothetical protein [Nostocoides japonicum]|nr:hypothetical protein [Tetrasphaera japonica]